MTLKDIEEVYQIELMSFNDPWSKKSFENELTINKDVSTFIVAQYNNKIIGYAGIYLIRGEGYIPNIAVHSNYRKMKVGELLFLNLLKIALVFKTTSITLQVRENNRPAINLYNKYHFIPVGIRKKYYIDTGENAIIMKLTIKDSREFYKELIYRINSIKEKIKLN